MKRVSKLWNPVAENNSKWCCLITCTPQH